MLKVISSFLELLATCLCKGFCCKREGVTQGWEWAAEGGQGCSFIVAMTSCADLRELMALPCKECMSLEFPNKSVKRASPRAQKPLYFFPCLEWAIYSALCVWCKRTKCFSIGWLKYGKQVVKIQQLQANVPCLQHTMFHTKFSQRLWMERCNLDI